MKKKAFVAGIIVIILAGIAFFVWHQQRHANDRLPTDHIVVAEGRRLRVRVAETPDARTLGLSYARTLPADQGMIFLFEKPDSYAFWMKGMRFPLDVIWLKRVSYNTFLVTGGESGVRPESYPAAFVSSEPVDAFLELNPGGLGPIDSLIGMELVLRENGI